MRTSRSTQPGVLSKPPAPRGLRHWVQRLGVLGFAFFLIKGLLWLTVPALLAYWAQQ